MLLTEQLFDTSIETINEGSEKNLYVNGVFLQADVKNRNGRIYPSTVMDPAVNKFIAEYVNTRRAVGEAEHPASSSIGIDRVSHLITEVSKDGTNYVGKAKILNTPMGNLIKGLLEGGVQMGVSSRGTGATKRRADGISEVTSFNLYTVDMVYAPSAPDAFVTTLVESELIEKVFANNKFLVEFEEFLAFKKKLKTSAKSERAKLAFADFDKLLSGFK